MIRLSVLLVLSLGAATPALAQQIPGPYGPAVTLAQAERIIDAARGEAARRKDSLAAGPTAIVTIPGAVAVEGGAPILTTGRMIGALGVSGGSSEEDGQVAAVRRAALR